MFGEGSIAFKGAPVVLKKKIRFAESGASGERMLEISNEHSATDDTGGEFDRSRNNARLSRQEALELLCLPKTVALCTMGVKVGP